MSDSTEGAHLPSTLAAKPLQAAKFGGITLSLVLGVLGFFRVLDAPGTGGDALLGDGQFLALILLPVVSLLLVCVVFLETLATGYRLLRSDDALGEHVGGRAGYVLLRVAEAAVAVVGVALIVTALPALVAESTPAPAGVGILLLLFVVGIAILVASLVRSGAELFVFRDAET